MHTLPTITLLDTALLCGERKLSSNRLNSLKRLFNQT
mgnify:FL=1